MVGILNTADAEWRHRSGRSRDRVPVEKTVPAIDEEELGAVETGYGIQGEILRQIFGPDPIRW